MGRKFRRSENNYRELKKRLSKIHNFSFNLPPKNKKLLPQQKSAITRAAKKYLDPLKRVDDQKYSFIAKKKGVNMDKIPHTIKTNKGVFYPKPGAEIVFNKVKGKKKQASIILKYKSIRERYFPFPLEIRGNFELMSMYVDALREQYKPDYIMWAIYGNPGLRYSEERFGQYVPDLNQSNVVRKKLLTQDESLRGISGVFLGF